MAAHLNGTTAPADVRSSEFSGRSRSAIIESRESAVSEVTLYIT